MFDGGRCAFFGTVTPFLGIRASRPGASPADGKEKAGPNGTGFHVSDAVGAERRGAYREVGTRVSLALIFEWSTSM